jgi:hypothetical protein
VTALAVIQIEGVLAQVYGTATAARPINDAIFLYEGLRRHWKIALFSVEFEHEEAARWLKINGFTGYDKLECITLLPNNPERSSISAMSVTTAYRANGWEVGPLLTADPLVAKSVLQLGIPVWMLAHPAYIRPQHRPDAVSTPRAWDILTEEIELQREMKSTDSRLEDEDVIGGLGRQDAP